MSKIANLLRKVLDIQTLKICVVNPATILSSDRFKKDFKGLPVIFIFSSAVEDIKVIDTGIVVKKKK